MSMVICLPCVEARRFYPTLRDPNQLDHDRHRSCQDCTDYRKSARIILARDYDFERDKVTEADLTLETVFI
jgi:hypothetical protein